MNNRDFIQKLKTIRIEPDKAWKEKNGEILFSQVFCGININKVESEKKLTESLMITLKALFNFDPLAKLFSKPVWTVAAVIITIFGGGIFSLKAAKDTKPGDSLYIAKIISEKTQLALTFDEEQKTKLGIEHAGNRAKEIAQVKEEEGKGEPEKNEKVEKLSADFKKEITNTKQRLEKIGIKATVNKDEGKKVDENKNNDKVAQNDDKKADNKNEEGEVFGANLGKDDKGMQISEEQKAKATATPEQKEINKESPDKILEQAEKLFEKEDYNGTVKMLEEINVLIDKIKSEGKVNSEKATSTVGQVEKDDMEISTK